MALNTPSLLPVNSFDGANTGTLYTFAFTVESGGTAYDGTRLTIFNTSQTQLLQISKSGTGTTFVLDSTDTTSHPLVNGTTYLVQIETYAGSTYSTPSSKQSFTCYTTPTLAISTPTVSTSSYMFSALYTQLENEGISNYIFTLYNINGNPISSHTYTTPMSAGSTLTHTFTELSDNTTYKIGVTGTTVGGTAISSTLTTFTVSYSGGTNENTFSAYNNCTQGIIVLTLNHIEQINDLESAQFVRLKRTRNYETLSDWVTIWQRGATALSNGQSIVDYTNQSGATYQYALVVVDYDNNEGAYYYLTDNNGILLPVYSEFDGVFIAEKTGVYRFYSNLNFGDTARNQKVGIFEPIGSRTPKIVKNGMTNYTTGNFSGNILQDDYVDTREIDRYAVTEKAEDLNNYLTNGSPKVLKDWNGSARIIYITEKPSVSHDSSVGGGYQQITFDYVEMGSVDNSADLEKNDLIQSSEPSVLNITAPAGTYVYATKGLNVSDGIVSESGTLELSTFNSGEWNIKCYLDKNTSGAEQKESTTSQAYETSIMLYENTTSTLVIPYVTLTINIGNIRVDNPSYSITGASRVVGGVTYTPTFTGNTTSASISFEMINRGTFNSSFSITSPFTQVYSNPIVVDGESLVYTVPNYAVYTVTQNDFGSKVDGVTISNNYTGGRVLFGTNTEITIKLIDNRNMTWSGIATTNPSGQYNENYIDTVVYGNTYSHTVTTKPDYLYNIGNPTLSDVTAGLFTSDSSGLLKITGSGDCQTYNVPDTRPWATTSSYIKTFEIEDATPTDISNYFYNCIHLESMGVLPISVTHANSTFARCGALTTMTNLPNNLAYTHRMFYDCPALVTSGTLPTGLYESYNMFESCTSLTTIPVLPPYIENASAMFRNCTSLTTVGRIPYGLIFVADMFSNCTALTGRIVIDTAPYEYDNMFYRSVGGATLYLDYTSNATNINSVVATRGDGSIFKGNLVT